jgi:uncharacterized protein YgiM (DUF1202 family)
MLGLKQRTCFVSILLFLALLWTGGSGVMRPVLAAPFVQSRVAVVAVAPIELIATADGAVVTTLQPGDAVTASGRSDDSQWVFVTTATGESGWAPVAGLVIFGVPNLPLVTATPPASPAAALAEATQPSAAAPTPTPDQTRTPEQPLPAGNVAQATPAMPEILSSTASITVTVNTAGGRLNVRTGPGTEYPVIAKVASDAHLSALARNAAGDWVQVAVADGQPQTRQGWVAADYVAAESALAELPVATDIPTPPTTTMLLAADQVASPGVQPTPTAAAPSAQAAGLQGKLVFSTGAGGLFYLYDLATGELRALTSGEDPALSPDGSRVVFTRGGGENGIYLINSDGSGEQKIFGERRLLKSPKWSPDGQWIVFSNSNGTWGCYLLGPTCRTESQIINGNPALANNPEAADKFLKTLEHVENPIWTLARIDTAGKEYRDLAALDTARAPDWSEAGIVYQSTAGLQETADQPDAVNRALVADHYVQDPDWQPGNSGRIVYQKRQGSHWEIFAANADGTGIVALTRPATVLVDQMPSNVAPAWSPDGQYIVFLSNREANNEAGNWRLWVMNADGSDQHPLPIDVPIAYNYGLEQAVSWGG